MNIKNLDRAAEIQQQLPVLEKGRSLLSQFDSFIRVGNDSGEEVSLPNTLKWNLAADINAEINKLKEEVTKL